MRTKILSTLMMLLLAVQPAFALGFNVKPAPRNAPYLITESDDRLPNATVLDLGDYVDTTTAVGAHRFLGNPTGSSAAPSFSLLTAADIPDLSSVYQPLDTQLTEIAGLSVSAGDIFVVNDSGAIVRLPGGSDTNVLTYDSSQNPNVKWAAAAGGGMTNPMTTTGDLITSSSGSTPDRIAAVAAGSLLRAAGTSTKPAWSTLTMPDTIASGTIFRASSANVLAATAYTMPSSASTSGKVLQSDGTNLVMSTATYAAPGTSGNVMTSDGTNWTSAAPAASGGGFGGSGSDGALTFNNTGRGLPQYNCTTLSTTNGTTTAVTSGIINATSTITIGNTINASATSGQGAFGGQYDAARPFGSSAGGGGGANALVSSDFTHGYGGAGAATGIGCYGGTGGSGTLSGLTALPRFTVPAGMGTAGTGASMAAGGAAGFGGQGMAWIAAGAISTTSAATLNFSGSAGGTAASSGGGGGGAAGHLLMASQASITTNASTTLTFTGGAGGNGTTTGGGGGGGAGGAIVMWAPTITNNATITATGGSGGTKAGTAVNGTAGNNGAVYTITATPSLPLTVWFLEKGGYREVAFLGKVEEALHGKDSKHAVHIRNANGTMAAFAASGDIVKYCQLRSERALFSSQESTATAPYCVENIKEHLKNAS